MQYRHHSTLMSEDDETVEVDFDRVMGISNSVAGDILSILRITLVVLGLYLSALGVAVRLTDIQFVPAAIPATIGGILVIGWSSIISLSNYVLVRGAQARFFYTPGLLRSEAEQATQEMVNLINGSYVAGFAAFGLLNGTISLGAGLVFAIAQPSGLYNAFSLGLSGLLAIFDFYAVYVIFKYVDWFTPFSYTRERLK